MIVHRQSVKVYLHIALHVQRECSAEPSMRSILSQIFPISPWFSPTIFYRDANKFSTPTCTPLYSSINRLYAQKNPVFEIVREESVKVYLHMYNGNVQQNPLYAQYCVTKESSTSPRFSRTIFDPDANSVLLRAHLCTAVTLCAENPVFEIVIVQESVKV